MAIILFKRVQSWKECQNEKRKKRDNAMRVFAWNDCCEFSTHAQRTPTIQTHTPHTLRSYLKHTYERNKFSSIEIRSVPQ